jgi:hypothetical protein
VILQDLDQDGRAELVVAGYKNQGQQFFLSIWARGTNGTWTERQTVTPPDQIQALAFADVTGDGKPEVLASSFAGFVTLTAKVDLYPVAAGQLGPKQDFVSFEGSVNDLAVADANGDGRADLYVPPGVFLAQPAGGFSGLQPFWLGEAGFFKVADLNRDSKLDVVGLDYNGAITILQHE